MIRIFISAILYLISMFTQAQEMKIDSDQVVRQMELDQAEKVVIEINKNQELDSCRFQQSKFEVNKKDLTFDRR